MRQISYIFAQPKKVAENKGCCFSSINIRTVTEFATEVIKGCV